MGSQHQNMLHRISPNAVWRHTVGLMSRIFFVSFVPLW
jgi:hypothetical protein